MAAILNASPKAILQGVRDESGGVLPVIPEQIPSHLPHFFGFAEEGPLEPQLVVGGSATRMFGAKTFDLRSKFATHQTLGATVNNGNGNAFIFQRLKPADANEAATLQLALEVVAEDLPEYNRNPDDSLELDVNGDPVPSGGTVSGHLARWIVREVPAGEFGTTANLAGALTNAATDQSTIYPILDFEISSFGEHGNLKGLRLWAPTERSVQPINSDVVYDQNAFTYRIQVIRRPDAKTQPNVVQTNSGSQSLEVALKPGAINTAVDRELDLEAVFLDAYQNLNVQPKQYGPFGRLHVYRQNLEDVSDLIYATEQAHQPAWPVDAEEGRYLVNLVGGQSVEGNPYHTVSMLGMADGGIELTSTSNQYARGGSDGTLGAAALDTLVANQVANYGDLEYSFMDMAYWPQSVIYDTGFSLDTKKKLLTPIGRRKDIAVVLSTQDVAQPQNSAEEESSMAIALRAAARLYPESEVFGTPVCRAVVMGHSGKLANSQYTGLAPLTIELINMASRFMGAGNGVWNRDRGFDTSPYNQITMFRSDTVNCTYKPQNVHDQDWNNGLVAVRNFDRRTLFVPGFQTVYDDATSVLNSIINMFIVVEVEKVAFRTWAELTGSAKLTREQFIERSNALITQKTQNRFDDRVEIVPETYFTDFDDALGYSWSCDIKLYMNNMRTVGTFTIISDRRENFAG